MQIKSLKMDYGYNGKAFVDIWAVCHTPDDCMQMIEWLQLAKVNMHQWEKISAKAALAEKAPDKVSASAK